MSDNGPENTEKAKRKSANRSGQIIPRGDNRWLVRIFLGRDENGKRRYTNKTIHGTKKDAQKWLTKAQRDRDLGIFVEPSTETVSQYISKWLETVAKPRVSEKTFEGYEWMLKHVKNQLGDIRLSELSTGDIQTFYASLSPSTARHAHAPLRSAMTAAVRARLIHINPCEAAQLPRHQAREMCALDRDEAARFLAVEGKFRALFAFAVTTGARPSEILGLKWADIDLDRATATIQRTLQWRQGPGKKAAANADEAKEKNKETHTGWYFTEPKTRRSRRSVPLPPGLVRQLRDHRLRQAEVLLSLGIRTDLVFTTDEGGPLLLRNLVNRHFKPALVVAKLPATLRLYDLRHTCASLLLQAGVHPKVVSERLGHASVTLTLDVYSHVVPGMQEQATAQLERMLFA
jgi:integrase